MSEESDVMSEKSDVLFKEPEPSKKTEYELCAGADVRAEATYTPNGKSRAVIENVKAHTVTSSQVVDLKNTRFPFLNLMSTLKSVSPGSFSYHMFYTLEWDEGGWSRFASVADAVKKLACGK
uniref:Uncharacterized protein n=2 Tax=Zooxanthella nutricula TaxID=1333877 RepID=A0A6U6UPZ2_9DINO|mmetsp:Transcript_8570/g.25510  ORF Transcript_8570/g.25510 Transcript_8570/m.25510 type:complete len:122 (+) Transcript_8570:444-809(+)